MRSMNPARRPAMSVAVPDRPLRLLVALLVLCLCGCSDPGAAGTAAAPADTAAGPAKLELTDGSRRTLADYAGKWLFVNYWAEWCGPCRDEIPELNALQAEQGRARVLGINFDDLAADKVREQSAALGIAFPVAVGDPGALLGIESPDVLPSTYVFDPEGRQVAVLHGPQTRETLHSVMGGAGAASGG